MDSILPSLVVVVVVAVVVAAGVAGVADGWNCGGCDWPGWIAGSPAGSAAEASP